MRIAARLLALPMLCGCFGLAPGADRPPPKAGAGVTLDGKTQTFGVDSTKVPVVPGCAAGQLVARTAEGWTCTEPIPGPTGDTGARGPTGPAGPAPIIATVEPGDANCSFGGTKVTVNGADTYVCNGATGAKGDTGATGSQGDIGSQGNQGLPGTSVVVAILDSGDTDCPEGGLKVASAAGEHSVCNASKGEPGDTGPQGPAGDTGSQGIQGVAGESILVVSIGPGHPQCPHGGSIFVTAGGGETTACNGPPGTKGDSGARGPIGESGSQGIQGVSGESVVGITLGAGHAECPFGGSKFTAGGVDTFACNGASGATGASGGTGPVGDTGPQGVQGSPGASIVSESIAGEQHCPFGGSRFTAGGVESFACNGAPGAKGDTGAQGPTGSAGPQGNRGVPGTSISSGPVAPGEAPCLAGGSVFQTDSEETYSCNGNPGVNAPTDAAWTGTLSVSHGGTGATAPSGARLALGLTAMALQSASNVSIVGGTVNATHTGDGSGVTNAKATAVRSDTSGACGTGEAGRVRFDGTHFQACNGAAWRQLDNAPTPCPAGYVLIPAGTFTMGSPADEQGHQQGDETQHQVTISRPFCMKRTEVTQAEWRGLIGGNPSYFASCGGICPVERVSWWDALYYANALSAAQGLQACYTLVSCSGAAGSSYSCAAATLVDLDCAGYRLPTEAEWEYAARAGTTTATYNGTSMLTGALPNSVLEPIAWFSGNSSGTAHAVRLKLANGGGLYDLLGNVWEWCWDWYEAYPNVATTDPLGPAAGVVRVFRGGSWYSGAERARAAERYNGLPDLRDSYLGFRLVRSGQ